MKQLGVVSLFAVCTVWGQTGAVDTSLGSRVRSEQLAHTPSDGRILKAERLLAAAPHDLRLKMELVSAYLQKVRESGDYSYLDRAGKVVDKILDQDSSSTAAAHFQNEIDLQRHRFSTVADRARGMAEYDPSDAASWANLGDASMELGRYEAAGNAYLRMFALRPDLASYNRLAYYRFVTGDATGAIGLMRQAVEAGSPMPENTAWCWAELGDMYFKLGRLNEAREAYTAAIRLFPRLHRALAGLGRVASTEGHAETAIKSYRSAQEIVPLVDYAAALEDLYAASGMKAKAEEQRALIDTIDKLGRATGTTKEEKTNRNLAVIYADHGRRLDRAVELIEAELPLRGDVYTWDAASWIFFKSGRLAEARTASVTALSLNTPEPAFYYHAREIANASGDAEKAAKYKARLSELNPHFVGALQARR